MGTEACPKPNHCSLTRTRKSKLREQNDPQPDLGVQYAGSKISRDILDAENDDGPFDQRSDQDELGNEEFADPEDDLGGQVMDKDDEIDSDEAFVSGDEQNFEGYIFRGSKQTISNHEEARFQDGDVDDLDRGIENEDKDSSAASFEDLASGSDRHKDDTFNQMEDDDEEQSVGSDSDDSSNSDESDEPKADDRAALRKMMAEEQKSVAASFSKALKADIEKGRAIKKQRTTFDTLLNTRIKLQKALIATNSMTAVASTPPDHTESILAAETAALNLWNTLSSLRSSLQIPISKKRPFSATSSSTSSDLWTHMKAQEDSFIPSRRANLTKWSQKTNPATALPRANRFSQTPTQQPLTTILDQHLSGPNREKLLYKTKIPRSCAPLQASSRTPHDPSIYDDADFYTLLLRDLVDQRMADPSTSTSTQNTQPLTATNGLATLPPLPSQRDLKVRKQVDTKASKGRKMRYTVHEKLQNFMAPDDRGRWGERQRNELFASLLGRRVGLGEDEGGDGIGDGIGDEVGEGNEGGLRLFG